MLHKLTQLVKQPHAGLGLIEVAIVFVLLTLAVAPIIAMMGKSGGGDGSTATTLNKQRTRELVAAHNIMERSLAGEILSFDVQNTGQLYNSLSLNNFDINLVPINGTPISFPNTGTYEYGDESQGLRLRYRWTFKDESHIKDLDLDSCNISNPNPSTSGCWRRMTPSGNRMVRATLDVFQADAAATDTPSYTFSTFLFSQDTLNKQETPKVGVVVVLDRSGSMMWFDDLAWPSAVYFGYEGVSSPFLKDRFHRTGGLPAGLNNSDIELFDDRDLDITWSMPKDDPNTPFDETYLRQGTLKLPTCDFENSALDWYVHKAPVGKNDPDTGREYRADQKNHYFDDVCKDTSGWSTKKWSKRIVPKISRIEAARNALLGFLVSLENDDDLVRNLELGFVTYSDKAEREVDLEAYQLKKDPANKNVLRPRYANSRDKFTWINRYDANYGSDPATRRTIAAGGKTNTYDGLKEARDNLMKHTNINNRIIILLTDGDPDPDTGNNSRNSLINYAAELNKKDGIKLFTIGFSGLSKDGRKMLEKMAENSEGLFFYANSAEELNKIFYSLSYELRRQLIMARVERYDDTFASKLY